MLPLNSPEAYQIFERAQAAWSAQRYPSVVSYTVEVDAKGPKQSGTRHYHEYWFARDNSVKIHPPVSDEQLEHPFVPPTGVGFYGLSIGGRRGYGDRDFIAPPVLAPNYSFGVTTYIVPQDLTPAQIVQQIRAEYHDPAPQKLLQLEQQSGLKTIAIITSSARDYSIRLVGTEPEDGHLDYHLALAPVRDPLKYRLRDLWIDAQTYAVDAARIGANFQDAATEWVPWMVRFAQIGGATYIASETAQKPITGRRALMYQTYRVEFNDLATTPPPPLTQLMAVPQALGEP